VPKAGSRGGGKGNVTISPAAQQAASRAGAALVRMSAADPRWLRLAEDSPEATAFHQPAWLEALTRTYGYRTLVLGVLGEKGEVAAGLPLARVRRPLSGVTFVSLPFTDHCPPLARDEPALDELAGSLRLWRRQPGGGELEVRGRLPASGGMTPELVGVRHLLPLDEASHELGSLKSSVARHVKAANRAGVKVQLGSSREDMKVFYRLHVQTRRRLGVPVQPWRFLNAVWQQVVEPGMGFLAVAESSSGEPVAAALFMTHGQSLIYKYGASDASRWELKPNHLLFWDVIGWGRQNGFLLLDFGRSDLASDGLRRFKAGWGAQEVPLEYTSSRGSTHGSAGEGRLAAGLGAVIRRSPAFVCRAVGELLYRYAA
jgi:CelD/BcsL family acetyltransferase involved in cellulose biosynthesis